MTAESANAPPYTCGRCDAPLGAPKDGDHCSNCGFPNSDIRSHQVERRIRAMRAALRPHDDRADRIGDVWIRGSLWYDDEPVEERTYTVQNIGGSESELLFEDGEWYDDFALIDGEFVRQPRPTGSTD